MNVRPLAPDRPVLITGAAGAVGHAIRSELTDAAIANIAVIRGFGDVGPGVINLDLASGRELVGVIGTVPAAVVHCAAVIPGQRDDDGESAGVQTQRIDEAVARAVQFWNCPAVYMSTCGVYATNRRRPAAETDALDDFTSPYLRAKRRGEKLFLSHPLSTVLRISAPVGPRIKDYYVLGRFISQALSGATIEVWGSGKREQDFVDVRDIADAVRRCLASQQHGVYNIVSGAPLSMLDLATLVSRLTGGGVACSRRPDPGEGVSARYSNAAAYAALGWQPTRTLRESVAWVIRERRSVRSA